MRTRPLFDPLESTPRQDGFRMPGEFEAHTGCWMLWPERPDNWRLRAAPAQKTFAAVAEAIGRSEAVTVGTSGKEFMKGREELPNSVRVVELSCNDAWMRDCGPTFVVNARGEVRGVDWEFNAWGGHDGGLYADWNQDALVARKVLEIERLARYRAPFVLEGGSIHVDGQGTLLTTEECLLNPNRNPQLSKTELEIYLQEYLNIRQIIWLGDGVVNDETSGHVDNLCCFVRPGVVVLTWTDDSDDPQYERSQQAYERLASTRDARGLPLEIHKLHQPGPLYLTEEESGGIEPAPGTLPRRAGDRLAASYVNFYIANREVIVPVFDDPQDVVALQRLAGLFPERKVCPIPAREILLGGGNIHCITQQQPGEGGEWERI